MNNNYIIGNSISAKIWGLYNPDYEIIGPVQQKTFVDPYARSSMIWLHDCVESRQLLLDLGWENPEKLIKKSKIGYFDDGVIRDKLTPQLKQTLVSKKMTPWDKPIESHRDKHDSARLSLTSSTEMTNFMNVLDVDHGEILKRLDQKVKVRHGFVGVITDNRLGITDTPPHQDSGYVYEKYNYLISTIPAPMFWRAWDNHHGGVPSKFESLPITFVNTKQKPKEFDGDYEMVYYDQTTPFTRISHLRDMYSIEFTGEINQERFEQICPDLKVEDIWTLPQGRVRSQFTLPPKGITFSGRFSQWQHTVTTETVIRDAIRYSKWSKNGNSITGKE